MIGRLGSLEIWAFVIDESVMRRMMDRNDGNAKNRQSVNLLA